MARATLVVATLLAAATEAMVGHAHGPAAKVGHGPSANGSRARCSPSVAPRGAATAANIWQSLDDSRWQPADDTSGQAPAVAGVEHSQATAQSAAKLFSDGVLTVCQQLLLPASIIAFKSHRLMIPGGKAWRLRRRQCCSSGSFGRQRQRALAVHAPTQTGHAYRLLLAAALSKPRHTRLPAQSRQQLVTGSSGYLHVALPSCSKLQFAASSPARPFAFCKQRLSSQTAVRGFLALRCQESPKGQSTTSGCSTNFHPPPPSGLVDRPTMAAEDGILPVLEPTTEQRSKTKRQTRKRGGRAKAKAAEQPEANREAAWPSCDVLNLTFLFRLMKPMPQFEADKLRALVNIIASRAARLAALRTTGRGGMRTREVRSRRRNGTRRRRRVEEWSNRVHE